MKTQRVHHLFSDLEANIFHVHDFLPFVTDIREQYPLLPLEETIALARECGVVPPTDPRTRQPIVMTTDQFLTVRQAGGFCYFARSIKYMNALGNSRTLEKLEIERRYFKVRSLDWGLVTDRQVDKNFVANVRWVRPYFRIVDLYPLTERVILKTSERLTQLVLNEELPLCELAAVCDAEFALTTGSSLAVARHLIANKVWPINMTERIEPCRPLVISSAYSSLQQTARRCG
ncbi:MAG: TnsA endonuclease N-terminal domain-containing protein [Blastocatellia bacterium]|nr:TnsA endonuclease N-terminal domain-containing protein [Blastocatellia bacterium]